MKILLIKYFKFLDDTNKLLLNPGNTTITTTSSHNSTSDMKPVEISCVSYIDATQRIVVFTTDISLAEFERKKESSSMEIFLALRGVELSIINNVNLEIATISLKDSLSSWSLESTDNMNEVKTFTSEYSQWLERNYMKYLNEKSYIQMSTINRSVVLLINSSSGSGGSEAVTDGTNAVVATNDQLTRFEIDFKNMLLLKPERGKLKRDWAPGLDVQYRTSANMTSLKCRIYNFQVEFLK